MGDGERMTSLAQLPARSADIFGAADLGVPASRRLRVAQALERAETMFVARVAEDGGIAPWRRSIEAHFLDTRGTFARTGRLSRADTAALVVALLDLVMRDRCWAQVESDRHPEWIGFWLHLVRRALPPYRAEPLFLLAWSAWRSGDAGLAARAVEAALVEEPCHVAATMLTTLLRNGVDPAVLPALSDRYGGAR
jgi:uncharacterized protein DUF4192